MNTNTNTIPVLTPEMIDTLDEGNRVMLLNPATNELVECVFHMLDEEYPIIFFTTANSRVEEYQTLQEEDYACREYSDYITHLRKLDVQQAAMPAFEMKKLIETKQYRLA